MRCPLIIFNAHIISDGSLARIFDLAIGARSYVKPDGMRAIGNVTGHTLCPAHLSPVLAVQTGILFGVPIIV